MKYIINGNIFHAENCANGILLNPILPKDLFDTDNSKRPDEHSIWWFTPFITLEIIEKVEGTVFQYIVWQLDGDAWDRPTLYGYFYDLDLALKKALELKNNSVNSTN